MRAVAVAAVALAASLAPVSASGVGGALPGGELVLACSGCDGTTSLTPALYTLTPRGRLRAIPGTDGGQEPSWSPDGRSIAYVRHELLVARADGSRSHPLTGRRSVSSLSAPDWSPDGRAIVYVRPAPVPLGCCRFDLWRIPAAGGRPQPVYAPRDSGYRPSWSPDGRRIAYDDSRRRLWSVASDGSGVRRLGNRSLRGNAPRWAPDGNSVAFIQSGRPQALSILGLRTSRVRRLLRLDVDVSALTSHAWSPDGNWLALARMHGRACENDPSSRCEELEVSVIRVRDGARRVIYTARYGAPAGLDWRG